jgi:hypothetical protein
MRLNVRPRAVMGYSGRGVLRTILSVDPRGAGGLQHGSSRRFKSSQAASTLCEKTSHAFTQESPWDGNRTFVSRYYRQDIDEVIGFLERKSLEYKETSTHIQIKGEVRHLSPEDEPSLATVK